MNHVIFNYRNDIKNLANFLQYRPSCSSHIGRMSNVINNIYKACEPLYRTDCKSGKIDNIVFNILFNDKSNRFKVKDLLSEASILIDANIILSVMQVRDNYDNKFFSPLELQLHIGYRPHTDIIRQLPRVYFMHPRYVAPIEDLFDYLAIEFYAGKKATNSEDGAIGWLVEYLQDKINKNNQKISLEDFSNNLKYWNYERLKECLDIWNNVVKPTIK